MRNKVYWGLGVLIVLFLCAFVLMMVNEYAEIKQLETDAKKAKDKVNPINQPKPSGKNPDKPLVAQESVKVNDEPKQLSVGGTESLDYEPTEEELARVREIDLEQLPKRIEFYKNAIPKAEERYNNLSIYIQKYPDADKWLREQLPEHKKTLERYKQQLSYAEYRLDLIRKEEMEENNENK